ncbi:LysR family transcriptional regulator [Labedella populi]|uniref:LysR family transcriptional regulator n=1 Tax=Labedella populi TaxID=2498850 RepID=A0A3S4ECE4_9MICO|nr:LysR family transcriptional regulator [Labedella populi]
MCVTWNASRCSATNSTSDGQRLGVAQPALSKRIRKIEAELGVELFARGGHSVSLTDAGVGLVAHAREVLARWRAMTPEGRVARRVALPWRGSAAPFVIRGRQIAARAPRGTVALVRV